MKQIFTTGDAAKILRVAPRTVSKWFDSGKLRGYRVPGSQDRRIPRDQLVRFMKDHGIPVPEGLLDPEEAPAPEAASTPAPAVTRWRWRQFGEKNQWSLRTDDDAARVVIEAGWHNPDGEPLPTIVTQNACCGDDDLDLPPIRPDSDVARLIEAAPVMLAALEKVAAGGGPVPVEVRVALALAKGVA
jgi:excisionase family DNA binding protein